MTKKHQLLRLPWFLLEEYRDFPPLILSDFIRLRSFYFKRLTGISLRSALLYRYHRAFTCFEKKSFLRYKRRLFSMLIHSPSWFERRYRREQNLVIRWKALTQHAGRIIQQNSSTPRDVEVLRTWHHLFLEIAMIGQPMNIIEFDDAWFSAYLRRSVFNHDRFIQLTNPFLRQQEGQSLTRTIQRLFALARHSVASKKRRYELLLVHKRLLENLAVRVARRKRISVVRVQSWPAESLFDFLVKKIPPPSYGRTYGTLFDRGGPVMLTVRETTSLIRRITNIEKTGASTLHGQCAMPGNVQGVVVVVREAKDCATMNKGAILVAHTTSVEFMPAVKQASAIVTDMGGLTCHAAIVARELKIPCVIGTKIATHVLKDGDRVEVDAEKGIVKKL